MGLETDGVLSAADFGKILDGHVEEGFEVGKSTHLILFAALPRWVGPRQKRLQRASKRFRQDALRRFCHQCHGSERYGRGHCEEVQRHPQRGTRER